MRYQAEPGNEGRGKVESSCQQIIRAILIFLTPLSTVNNHQSTVNSHQSSVNSQQSTMIPEKSIDTDVYKF